MGASTTFKALLVAASLAACGGDDGTGSPAPESAAVNTDTCDTPLPAPGEYEGLSQAATISHPYSVFVPESLDRTVPASMYLHLASGVGSLDVFLPIWRPYYANADVPGLVVAVGTEDGSSAESLVALIDHVAGEYCVDPDRIHAMGISTTSDDVVSFACGASDRVASFSSGLGNDRPLGVFCEPEPTRPVPLISFTGDENRRADAQFVTAWAELNACEAEPTIEDLGTGVSHAAYEGCDAAVELFDINGMGHLWPLHECLYDTHELAEQWCDEYDEVDYLEAAFRFFDENQMQ